MISFQDWLEIRETSATGRRKTQAALGLAPPVADIFSRSTPPPWQVERLDKALKKSHKKKKKKKKKIDEAKKKQAVVHNDIDSFIKSVEMLAKDVWELELVKKKKAAEDKMDQIAKRNTGSKKPEPEKSKIEKPEDEKPETPEKKTKEKENGPRRSSLPRRDSAKSTGESPDKSDAPKILPRPRTKPRPKTGEKE